MEPLSSTDVISVVLSARQALWNGTEDSQLNTVQKIIVQQVI